MNYRIYDKEKKRFLDKDYIVDQDGMVCVPIGKSVNGGKPHIFNAFVINQDLKIIQQSTGLHDKNGVEIYEGDILQFSNRYEWYRGSVVYSVDGIHIVSKNEILSDKDKYPYERRVVEVPKSYEYLLGSDTTTYWEVIGNIFENKELIENA